MSTFILLYRSILLKRGADYNIEDSDGARPDELAVIFRATDCHKAINVHRQQRTRHLVTLVERVKCYSQCGLNLSKLHLSELALAMSQWLPSEYLTWH